ncbi:uncharacterized protein LOC130512645 [Raphanus sativus]|uniref:Uncharacterized protein LOC130512645 n=1 Tax=Raphanus sativus TaxID=3726 RepID=A0A9W3DT08_RAPSA|nr:uncharacterized protein LOC130512645 [Raphanus sativus]
MAKEWTNAQDKPQKTQTKIPSRTIVPENCDSLQSDAAWRASTQLAGFGWIIKTEATSVARFSTGDVVSSALIAEAMAMRHAVRESSILGCRRMVCESDSTQLIKALNGSDAPLEIYGIVADILDLSSLFEVIVFVWIPREKNSTADGLAKTGSCCR